MRDGRWWFRFGPRWTYGDRPLRWMPAKSVTTSGGRSLSARCAQLLRKAKTKTKTKGAAAAGLTELLIDGARIARFGRRWLAASGAFYETPAHGTSEHIEAAQ